MSAQPLAIYRGLLREVRKQFTGQNQNLMWHTYVRDQFRMKRDAQEVSKHIRSAEDALLFLKSNRTHKELLTSYFPTMAEDERISRTAGRVGLQLPKILATVNENIGHKAEQAVNSAN